MEKHPDSQPCSTETVNRCDDYDGECDEQFESNWIYDGTSVVLYTKKDAKRCQRNASNLSKSLELRKQRIRRLLDEYNLGRVQSGLYKYLTRKVQIGPTRTSLEQFKFALQGPH